MFSISLATAMSDFIYGSSLRAAKSKANYLFEGDFRRRPNQNFSGASRGLARDELLQQAVEQRQSREDERRRIQATITIQSAWRGHQSRQECRNKMRHKFDTVLHNVRDKPDEDPSRLANFEWLMGEFIVFHQSTKDKSRFDSVISLIIQHPSLLMQFKDKRPTIWLHQLKRILRLDLVLLDRHCDELGSPYIDFLDKLTSRRDILDANHETSVWSTLINVGFFKVMRKLIDAQPNIDARASSIYVGLLGRSLDVDYQRHPIEARISVVKKFFNEFLKGPFDNIIDDYYTKILQLKPRSLNGSTILSEFNRIYTRPRVVSVFDSFLTSSNTAKNKVEDIWFCYSFVRTISHQIQDLNDADKTLYVNLLGLIIMPAETLARSNLIKSLAASVATEDSSPLTMSTNCDNPSDSGPILVPGVASNRSITINPENSINDGIDDVIFKIIDLINDSCHISNLKSIINTCEPHSLVQKSVIRICNLMLAHESFAIFNCRLLYTVAFSRDFLRSLWKSIMTTTLKGQSERNSPSYWRAIMPQLELFCSLYSYLIPTLDDEEFMTTSASDHKKIIDEELVSISRALRDMCVNLIELLYQDCYTSRLFVEGVQVDHDEIEICFGALVRLVRQLHSRDARIRFCPEGHWICPSIVIPMNQIIDFDLATIKPGRDRPASTLIESKTALILREIPFVIPFHDRVEILHNLLLREKLVHQSEGYHFGLPGSAIQVRIRRSHIYEDAFEKLVFDKAPNLKLPLKVTLINQMRMEEAGIDGGGLTKEFICEVLKAGFNPMRGFFKSTKDHLLYPNPAANVLFLNLPDGYLVHYEFLGRMLGKAIFEKTMVELPLAIFFLSKLLARQHSSDVDMHNLASLDPILYKNLVYLKNYKGDVADLNLDFTISNNELGEHEVVELKPGGSRMPVTRENKIEYVHLVADYRLNKQIRAQCAAFKQGLSQLINLDWLRMFDPRELQILISGAPTPIDVSDWRRNTVYANGYDDDCEVISTFWRCVARFDEDQKRKLLKFTTSCSLAPLLGFKDLVPNFSIAPSEGSRLPTASTCMNLLKLPECKDENVMFSKLIYAIESNSGFDLS